jgi:hypothetical protein
MLFKVPVGGSCEREEGRIGAEFKGRELLLFKDQGDHALYMM